MGRSLIAVVMAGGTGTRLYPASRSDRPKQFLSLGGDRSLLARTVDRLDFADEVVVATRSAFADAVESHAPEAEVLVEPVAKDTGPALVYAAHRLRERADVLVCLPSDHHVAGPFAATVDTAAGIAADTGSLVTIGVAPDRPATAYGYIVPGRDHGEYLDVDRFYEKPDASTAREFVADGALWNAGMFAWTPEALLREARDSPLASFVDALDGTPQRAFETVDSISVDRAILERTDRAVVVPGTFEWDDLGSWDAVGRSADAPLCDTLAMDGAGNVIACDGKHVTTIGVSDLVIAAYDDRVLVVPKADAQRVGDAVEELRDRDLY